MDKPKCCVFPNWCRIDPDGTSFVCETCGCVWDMYRGVIEEGSGGFQIEDIPRESEDHLYED